MSNNSDKPINIKIPFTETQSLWIIGFVVLILNGYSIYFQLTHSLFFYYEALETTPSITTWSWFSVAGEIAIIGIMLYDQLPRILPSINISYKTQD